VHTLLPAPLVQVVNTRSTTASQSTPYLLCLVRSFCARARVHHSISAKESVAGSAEVESRGCELV